jgi:hypothetical protein
MSNTREIVAMLRTSELRQSVVRSLCSSTVALFALFPEKRGAQISTAIIHCLVTSIMLSSASRSMSLL